MLSATESVASKSRFALDQPSIISADPRRPRSRARLVAGARQPQRRGNFKTIPAGRHFPKFVARILISAFSKIEINSAKNLIRGDSSIEISVAQDRSRKRSTATTRSIAPALVVDRKSSSRWISVCCLKNYRELRQSWQLLFEIRRAQCCYHFATQLAGTGQDGLIRRRECKGVLCPKTLTKWHAIELGGMAEAERAIHARLGTQGTILSRIGAYARFGSKRSSARSTASSEIRVRGQR